MPALVSSPITIGSGSVRWVLKQGDTKQGRILFSQGTPTRITTFSAGIATLDSSCYSVGSRVHLVGLTPCAQLFEGVCDVAAKTATTVTLAPADGQVLPPVLNDSFLSLSVNLRAFQVRGWITSRPVNATFLSEAKGSIAENSSLLRLIGLHDVVPGDRIQMPGVFFGSEPVRSVQHGKTNTIVQLQGRLGAGSTVSLAEPRSVTIEGGVIAEIETTVNGPLGTVDYVLRAPALARVQFEKCCGLKRVGCFEIVLANGPIPLINSALPHSRVWRQSIVNGELYMEPAAV